MPGCHGGCGFIGSNFIRDQLARYPEQSVVNIDKLTYAGNPENLADVDGDPRYRLQQGDILRPGIRAGRDEFRQGRGGRQFCRGKPRRSQHPRFGPLCPNKHRGDAGAPRCVPPGERAPVCAGSTDEVYGSLGSEGFFTEETPLAPNSPYSASKAAADVLVRAYYHTFGFSGRHYALFEQLRSLPVSGKDHSVVYLAALDDKPLPVYGKGDNVRDWIHVLDHCRGIDAAMRRGQPGEVYNFAATRRSAISISPACCSSCSASRRR